MQSERVIRNGFMGLVVHISNKLLKKYETKDSTAADKKEDTTVIDYLDSCGEEWRAFVDDELKKSNENNNRTLGGSTRTTTSDDEEKDDSNYDVQMEKIMARFTNFNQILSQGSASQDDDDDDDEEENTQEDKHDEDNYDEDDEEDKETSGSDAGVKIQKVEIKEVEPLQNEFMDSNYWKVGEPKEDEIDIDSLLAELED